MRYTTIVITDGEELALALCRYVEHLLGMECYHFTYSNSELMSGEVFQKADIFLLELLRIYKNWHIRAEGIFVAESLLKQGRKVLLIAANALGDKIKSPIYWDIACSFPLKEKIKQALEGNYDWKEEIEKIKQFYKELLSPPSHHHHNLRS